MSKLLVLSIIFSFYQLHAQQASQDAGGLNVGERFAFPAVDHALNVPEGRLDLADFKGKLLILDFWGHGCSSCIASFPRLDSLQRQFADRVQFVLVNRESEELTRNFLGRLKKIRTPSIPMVTEDSILHQLFPHTLVPHVAWIDTAGRVAYITDWSSLYESQIRSYLAGEHPSLPNARHIADPEVLNSPLRDVLRGHEIAYSLLTRAISGVTIFNRNVRSIDDTFSGNRYSRNSNSAMELFIGAFEEGGKYNLSSPLLWEFEGIDTFAVVRTNIDSLKPNWYQNYSYNYDLLVPMDLKAELFAFMQQDLQRYFGISASRVKRRKQVWEIAIVDSVRFQMAVIESKTGNFKRFSMAGLAQRLQRRLSLDGIETIVTDGTNTGNQPFTFEMRLPKNTLLTPELINELFQALGLGLEEKTLEIWVLRIESR